MIWWQISCELPSYFIGEFDNYLKTRRRKRSDESEGSVSSQSQCERQEDPVKDPVKTKIIQAPRNIARNQRMLKTGLLNLQGGPLFFERLELNIPQIRYNAQSLRDGGNCPKQKIFPNAKFNAVKQSSDNKDKWRGWNKQLRSSLKYWKRRFPCTELSQCSHTIRKDCRMTEIFTSIFNTSNYFGFFIGLFLLTSHLFQDCEEVHSALPHHAMPQMWRSRLFVPANCRVSLTIKIIRKNNIFILQAGQHSILLHCSALTVAF